jgi:Cdc6-like AAA superfamily ATPase
MAEASPICRGKNLTFETVLSFVNAMPLVPMKKAEFHRITESKLKGWTQTHSQIARQLALYQEKDGMCIPRFTRKVSCSEILRYVENWAKLYFVPNIYTPSLNGSGNRATNIYAFLKNEVKLGESSYSKACTQMFGIELNNTDKIRVYLNNFTDLIINDDAMSVNQHLSDCSMPEVYPKIAIESAEDYFNYFSIDLPCGIEDSPIMETYLQQIFYGAPGTGKSHTIKEVTRNEDVIRTTFHPDTDYSSFVGAYKPTTIEETVMTVIGTKAVPVEDVDGNERKESKIIYEFVAQSFLQAYIAAWKKYAGTENREPEKQFLVIEEINRGNCAQIFGDLFQLLDRNCDGFSEYPIKADADMKKQLQKAFKGLDIPQKHSINAMYEDRDVVKEVLDGDLLLLPNNLYVWATMNTSDQSLFPIDSAFKRRWDWTYIPISNANKGWTINIGDSHYDWWQFVERINDLIGRTTNSEDKKLGYFFCKAKDGVISAETFVGKVIFYLWNDVFKDYDYCDQVFNDADGNKLTFDKFYTAEGNNSKVVEEKVKLFLKNLGLEASVQQENMDEDLDSKIIIKVNGKDVTKANAIPYTAIEEYVKLHPEMSAQEVVDIWKPFKKCSMRSWIVCNKEERDEMDQRYANYSYEIKCADGNSLWVNKDGWMHHPENKNLRDTVSEFIEAVNGADLGITITETTI